MFCPRCGRAVTPNANFCGGCGLSRSEIEKYIAATQPKAEEAKTEEIKTEPAQQFTPPEIQETPAETQQPVQNESIFAQFEKLQAETEKNRAQAEAFAKEEPAESYKAFEAAKAEEAAAAHNTADAGFNAQSSTAQTGFADAEYTDSTAEEKKEIPLTTVDFIWMFVISSLPLIGLIYIIYLAVQDNNTNKRSFARATIIVSVFSIIICLLFMVGLVAAGMI